jgi:Cu/Ag efflux pump CusA
VADVDSAELSVSMDANTDYDETMSAIETVVRSHPGLSSNVQAYMSSKMREALTGDDKLVTVRVYGQDPAILASKAEEIRALLAGIDGVKDPKVESQAMSPTIQIGVDLEKAAHYGLKPGDVRRATSVLVSGITVGALFQDQKVFDVVVWGTPEIRDNLSKLQNLLIDTKSGEQVRLADVATVRVAPALSVIRRQGVSRRIDVDAGVAGRSVADVRHDVAQRIAGISFPFEYHAELLGKSRSAGLVGYVAAAAAVMFLLLQAAIRSWRLAAASVVAIPVIGAGALMATLLTDGALSLASLVGFAAILGIAIQHGLALVMYFERLERLGGERARHVLVLDGLRERTPAILVTYVAIAAFFLPFTLLEGSAGLELAYPAAVAAIGSLLATVLVTLVVVPAVYLKFGAGAAAGAEEEDVALDGIPAGA